MLSVNFYLCFLIDFMKFSVRSWNVSTMFNRIFIRIFGNESRKQKFILSFKYLYFSRISYQRSLPSLSYFMNTNFKKEKLNVGKTNEKKTDWGSIYVLSKFDNSAFVRSKSIFEFFRICIPFSLGSKHWANDFVIL